MLAELALRTDASGLARAAYERLIAMHPRVPLFRYLFAKVLTEVNAPRAALADYARALELGTGRRRRPSLPLAVWPKSL